MFPDRVTAGDNNELKQKCSICETFICNLYLPPCTSNNNQNKLNVLKNMKVPNSINNYIFRGNKYEVEILNEFLKERKLTTQQVFNEMLTRGIFTYVINKHIMQNILND